MANLINVISTDTLYNMFCNSVNFWYEGFDGRKLSATIVQKPLMRRMKRF